MGKPRVQLQALLETLLGSPNVYFQPPEQFKLSYPCIIYNREFSAVLHADNNPYNVEKRYLLTVITHDADSNIPDKIEWLPKASFQRFFTRDQLNHHIFTLFY